LILLLTFLNFIKVYSALDHTDSSTLHPFDSPVLNFKLMLVAEPFNGPVHE